MSGVAARSAGLEQRRAAARASSPRPRRYARGRARRLGRVKRRRCGVSVRIAPREGLRQLSTPSTVRESPEASNRCEAVVDVPRAVRRSEAPVLGSGSSTIRWLGWGLNERLLYVHTVISAANAASHPATNSKTTYQQLKVHVRVTPRRSARGSARGSARRALRELSCGRSPAVHARN